MATARAFRDLRVYQAAFDGACRIHELSRSFPLDERYSLTDQVRKSSRSVCANIAEAWRKRRYPAHFASKLSDADAEAAETSVWLDFAHRFRYLSDAQHEELRAIYERINGQLWRMMASPSKWTPTDDKS